MSEDGEGRCREPKTVYEEHKLVKKAIPSSTKYKNNKKTPEGVYAGFVGLRKNYGYVGWQWKVV